MARNQRTEGQKEYDRNIITNLYLKGKSVRYIADYITERTDRTITYQTVHNDIKKIFDEWREERADLITNQITIELAKIDRLEQEANEMWEKSKEDYIQKGKKKKGKDGKVNYIEVTEDEKRGVGNPKYLDIIEKCIMDRCRLLELYSDKLKIEEKRERRPLIKFG